MKPSKPSPIKRTTKPLKLLKRNRLCTVRGCHNRVSYIITRSDQRYQGEPRMCEDCIMAAAAILDEMRVQDIEEALDMRDDPSDKDTKETKKEETPKPKQAKRGAKT